MADKNQEPVDQSASTRLEIEDLLMKISALNEKEQYVIKRRMNEDQFKDIGESLGRSKQRAQQIEEFAKKKLREMYRKENREIALV